MTFNRTEQALIDSLQSHQNSIEQLRAKIIHSHAAIKLIADHIGLSNKSLNAAVDKLILDTTTRIDLENLFNDDK